MAITQKQAPKTFAPVYNPIEWVLDSDKKTEDSFKYVADVFVSGVTTPAFFRLKTQAHPTLGFGVFDVHRILENFLSSDIDKSTFGFQRNQQSFIRYDIKFGEEFDATPAASSGTTVFPDLLVKTDNFVINAAQEFLDWKDFATDDFLIGSDSVARRFLTNAPTLLRKIRNGADAWLHLMWDTTNEVDQMQVTTFDTNENKIQIVRIQNNFTDVSDHVQRFLRVSAGFNMNSIASGDVIFGSLPVLTTSVKRYIINIFGTSVGSEIILNGDFSASGANWNNEGPVVWLFDGSDAAAANVTSGFPAILTQNLTTTLLANKIYKLTFDILTSTNSNLNVELEGPSPFSENFTTTGTKTIIIDLTGLTNKSKILFTHTELASGADLVEIDNVSIKEQGAKMIDQEFLIDYECTKHDIFTVHFLNKLGGFDTFSFIRLSRRIADIDRIEYKKNTGTLKADGTIVYAGTDRGIVTLDTSIRDRVTVSSDWLTEEESIWLQELITSPEVFFDNGTELQAINIKNTRYEKKKRANDVIFNYELEFEFGQIHSRQRG